MKKLKILNVCLVLCGLLTIACTPQQKSEGTIKIDFSSKGAEIPTSMYGVFFEEINHAGDGGLYAELVQNRGFEETSIPEGYRVEGDRIFPPAEAKNHLSHHHPSGNMSFRWPKEEIPAWSLSQQTGNGGTMKLTKERPLHQATPTSLQINLPGANDRVTLTNSGYWGMNVVQNDNYDLRFYARKNNQYKGNLVVRLTSPAGKVLSENKVSLNNNNDWNEYKIRITPTGSDHKGVLTFNFEGAGTIWLDYVSLFPEKTFKNRPNGLRKDVAEVLQDMKPAFIRWPGGCVVEGISLSNRIKWKETIGDPMTRPGLYDTWGYRTTMGFGYHEFLQYCEDLGAEGMFVCNAGIGCQARVGDACSDSELQAFIDEALDAIEYALGDETTVWGKKRIENGHPGKFPLKYVEIGNENWGEVYAKRYDIFYDAIKAKYPDLILISTLGLGGQNEHKKVDMIDPHWYVAPETFFELHTIFDSQPRGDYKIYVGEYACNIGVGGGNLYAALGEAAFLTGMERNSDIVHMASYAPLLENVNDRVWATNLIWLDSYRVMGRSSYHVQKMYADNRPSYNLNTSMTQQSVKTEISGNIGLGTWETRAEFKDIKFTSPNGTVNTPDLNKLTDEWKILSGDWSQQGGILSQSSLNSQQWTIWRKESFGNEGTIEFKARKLEGNEGFMVYFGMNNNNGYALNIGGWGNVRTAFEKVTHGGLSQLKTDVSQHIENDRWYDFKIEYSGESFVYYCDGEKMLDITIDNNRCYAISGYDKETNEIVIKVVNAKDTPFTADIDLANVQVASNGKIIVLSSASQLDENSLDEPQKIIPVEKTWDKFGSSFTYSFEPWSFSIMRVKVK